MNTDELQNRVREAIYGHLMAWERQKGLKDMPIVEKYQNLSAQELSDLVLEGEEVFSIETGFQEPTVRYNQADMVGCPLFDVFLRGCRKFNVDEMVVGRRVSDDGYWIEMGGENYVVYDDDLYVYFNKTHLYFDEIVIRVE